MSTQQKADLHVHSRFSNRHSMWALRRFNCPESFTEPKAIYRLAKQRGMDFVTITDHNSIVGAQQISHLPGTFISTEATAYLPETGCKLHCVCLDIDVPQFERIMDARHNVYELVDYLRSEQIVHFLAHPLFDINRRLDKDTIEKMLLLFEAVEVRNGARAERYNRFTETMVRGLTPEAMERMACKHGVEPRGEQPWRKALVGGSDDHGGLFVASTYTVAQGGDRPAAYLKAIRAGRSEPGGSDGDALSLAHSIYAIGYRFFAGRDFAGGGRADGPDTERTGDGRRKRGQESASGSGQRSGTPSTRPARARAGDSTPLLTILGRRLLAADTQSLTLREKARLAVRSLLPESLRRDPQTFEESLEREAWRLLKDADFTQSLKPAGLNRRIFMVTSRLVDTLIYEYSRRLFDLRLDRGLAGLIEPLSTIGLIHVLTAPYYVSFHSQSRGRPLMADLAEVFPACREERKPRIALFTDTISDVNGVALTLRRLLAAADASGADLTIVTCDDGKPGLRDGVMHFGAVGDLRLPEYADLSLYFPPVLKVLDFLERERFTHIHVSTPGTMGALGLLAARLLDLPAGASYHTDLPQYVLKLTDDDDMGEMVWSLLVWFYSQFDEVLVPSRATMSQLEARGISRAAMKPLPRWVDTELFSPAAIDPGVWPRLGVAGGVRLLYAGRVSREKDLELLSAVFRRLVDNGTDVTLIVAGDGPFRADMEGALRGYPARFLGFVPQIQLATLYASADLLVFPSSTDTFGNVVLEAQACGLPVLVSDQGGPHELVVDGDTGVVLPAHDEARWTEAIASLVADSELRRRMSEAARRFVTGRSLALEHHFSTLLRPGADISSPGPTMAFPTPSRDAAADYAAAGPVRAEA